MNNELSNFNKIKKGCCRNCYIIGPTARCNKSSIYIFKW